MTIPRIARIHLVYQFIILTLLVLAIGYNGILLDKKYLFLALIPVFCYQLMIVFYCTELLPLPSWINVQEYASRSKDTLLETKAPRNENLEPIQKPVQSSGSIFPNKLSSFKYSLKNRKSDIVSNKALKAQEINACGTEIRNSITVSKTNSRQGEFETPKSCYFPYCQKRSKEWIEQNETRPYKVRSLKSGNENKNSNSPFNQKSPIQIRYVDEHKPPIPIESGNENQYEENDPDLKKSYSFPFRLKKLEKFLECEENLENDVNIPIMPPWKALNFRKPVNSYEGRRKSVSTEALNEELKLIKSSCQQERNDFTQSMELTGTLSLDACAVKNPLKPTTSLSKFKQGIVNCFIKNKRDGFKTDETKQNSETRNFLRELSKGSLNFESVEKEKSAKEVKSIKPKNGSKLELFQPSYVSYASDSFTDDVKVHSNPYNFKKYF